jgi:hypothetical protein
MARYQVTSDQTELPRGSRVYVIPAEPQADQLVMFGTALRDKIWIGRWIPNVGGRNWVLQPGRLIKESPECKFIILGVVVPCEDPPKEITNLSVAEYVSVLLNAKEARG